MKLTGIIMTVFAPFLFLMAFGLAENYEGLSMFIGFTSIPLLITGIILIVKGRNR